jgi:hypothetical protein
MEFVDQDVNHDTKESLHRDDGVKLASSRVLEELKNKNDTWENFLVRNQFGEAQKVRRETQPEEVRG